MELRNIVGLKKRCCVPGCGKVAKREFVINGHNYAICDNCIQNVTNCIKKDAKPNTNDVKTDKTSQNITK